MTSAVDERDVEATAISCSIWLPVEKACQLPLSLEIAKAAG